MPEYLKAMLIVMGLAGIVFAWAQKPVTAVVMTGEDFKRRRNLWIAISLVAFLSRDVWIYMLCSAAMLFATNGKERNPLALFYFLLFAVPSAPAAIPGFGLVNYLFAINHIRLLTLAVLLPAWLRIAKRPDSEPFGAVAADKYVIAYVALMFGLELTATTFTDALRHLFYVSIDIVLPYYVASRSVRRLEDFNDVLAAFVFASLLMVPIALFEFMKHWLLYEPLVNAQGLVWGIQSYLWRGSSLRALASTGQPIALGYVMVIATVFYLYLKPYVQGRVARTVCLLAFIGGLVVPLSRGPWVGLVAMMLMLMLTGPAPLQRLLLVAVSALLVLPVALISPWANTVVDYLPFVGQVDAGNVEYRKVLFYTALDVIWDHPWFGSSDYLLDPRMQPLMQGQGIIDVVNSYLEIALHSGFVGLALFGAIFLSLVFQIVGTLRSIADRSNDQYRLGAALLAVLVGILVMIATASGVTVIPIIYWSVAGLSAAYLRLQSREQRVASQDGMASTSHVSMPARAWS